MTKMASALILFCVVGGIVVLTAASPNGVDARPEAAGTGAMLLAAAAVLRQRSKLYRTK